MGQSVLTVWSIGLFLHLPQYWKIFFIWSTLSLIIHTLLSGFALLCIVWISGNQKRPCCLYHFLVINTGEFPSQRPVTRFDVFFDLRLNKRLSKQLWGWWFETLSRSIWHQRNGWENWHHDNSPFSASDNNYSAAKYDKVVIRTTPCAFMNAITLRTIV